MAAQGQRDPADRERAVVRYLELRPVIRARMEASVPLGLRDEFASVTAHQVQALLRLPDAGLTIRELATAMRVMRATATVLADRLVAQGLASREHEAHDRRVVRLVPTEWGRALAALARDAQRDTADMLLDRLSDAQVDAFLDVLETLAGHAPADAGTPAPLVAGGLR